MSNGPFMPKATAVWWVENTTLCFKQIENFCKLHELEVKGIADGDVAKGIKAYNPILAGQLTTEKIEECSKKKSQFFLVPPWKSYEMYFSCQDKPVENPRVDVQTQNFQRVLKPSKIQKNVQ